MTEGDTVESESSADQAKIAGEKVARDRLIGKTAIITGASAGIGLSVARKLAEAGANVVLVARGREKLDAAAASIGLERAMSFAADVSHFDSLRELLRAARERFGRIDILVNNAGLNHRGPAVGISPDTLAAIITTNRPQNAKSMADEAYEGRQAEVNLTAPVFLSRLVAEHMVQQGAGSIINVASLAGKIPVKDEAAYSASKAGLRAFGRALAMELDPIRQGSMERIGCRTSALRGRRQRDKTGGTGAMVGSERKNRHKVWRSSRGRVGERAGLAGSVPLPLLDCKAVLYWSKPSNVTFGVRVSTVCPGPVDTEFLGALEHVPDIVLSQPMVTPDDVADAVLACITSGKREVSLPALSGLLTTLGYVFPSLAAALHPLLERRGAANRRRYVAARAAGRAV
ncbi:SDR family NAD(P)-dependent oxidoreductase [Pendulispora rubella]|uniref:SDR family NAD(P)-dependent oxidoreductase n=1 Tax=Pendulispora rubella TaxID=2741070 RepID=A0ABZ2LK15_9BACT